MNDLTALLDIADQALDLVRATLRTERAGEADLAAERAVRDFLASRTPEIGVLGEEEGLAGGLRSDRLWVLDPIDGTENQRRALPMYAVSLGLAVRGVPVIGAVDLPALGKRYRAAEGLGARLNGRSLRVATPGRLSDALVSIGEFAVPGKPECKNQQRLDLVARLAGTAGRLRLLGSAAFELVSVAEGALDASVTLANHPWDMCAGVVVAREAGAVVCDSHSRGYTFDSNEVVAASPGLAPQLTELVHRVFEGLPPGM